MQNYGGVGQCFSPAKIFAKIVTTKCAPIQLRSTTIIGVRTQLLYRNEGHYSTLSLAVFEWYLKGVN